jgi:hypothetical protein
MLVKSQLHCSFAVGGDNGVESLKSVERYDTEFNMWTLVAPLNEKRKGVGTASLNGKLYAVGGWNASSGYLNSVERYDPGL